MARLRDMGIQRRIMLYVTAGLVVMFGSLIIMGLHALDEATQLVFETRLGTAESLALTLERDLIHVASDVRGFASDLTTTTERAVLDQRVTDVMQHLVTSDSFAFFDSDGVIVFDLDGHVLASAGVAFTVHLPAPDSDVTDDDDMQVVSTVEGSSADSSFAVVATRVGHGADGVAVAVHLSGRNSAQSFVPEDYIGAGTHAEASDGSYHLEVIGSRGRVVLGVGGDEHPGETSQHFAAILDLGGTPEPVILRHLVSETSGAADHVMGVVPISEFGLTLVLEQPIDVALALPLQLRQRLIMWSAIGFLVSLAVAWVTTRAVAVPTRRLTVAAERIAGGDLDSPIHISARDEFGVLAERFEAMRQQVRSAYEAVEEANQELEQRVRERTARLGTLLNQIISAQEDERRRLARELHDETAQTLGALSISLARACDEGADDGARLGELVKSREMVAMLLEETRRLIFDLRPLLLDDLGLIPAIRWLADTRLEDSGIAVQLDIDGPPERLPPHIETAVFRIVQEAMNNVVKYSGAGHVTIHLSTRDHALRIIVSDDGIGFDVDAAAGGATFGDHAGLAGMGERVNLLGGQMSIHSTLGVGTTITVEIPLIGMTT